MNKILAFLCLLGAAGIALGAFGAHAIKTNLTPERLHSFETAVRYQLFHVIIALVMGCSSFFFRKSKKNNCPNFYYWNPIVFGIDLHDCPRMGCCSIHLVFNTSWRPFFNRWMAKNVL